MPVFASSIMYVPVVADLLHRHQRRVPVDRALVRHQVLVVAAVVVVHVRRDQVLGHGFDRVRRRRRIRYAWPKSRQIPARPTRGPVRASPTSDAGVDSAFGITSSATRTPSGSAARQISSTLRERPPRGCCRRRRLVGRRRPECTTSTSNGIRLRDLQRRARPRRTAACRLAASLAAFEYAGCPLDRRRETGR